MERDDPYHPRQFNDLDTPEKRKKDAGELRAREGTAVLGSRTMELYACLVDDIPLGEGRVDHA